MNMSNAIAALNLLEALPNLAARSPAVMNIATPTYQVASMHTPISAIASKICILRSALMNGAYIANIQANIFGFRRAIKNPCPKLECPENRFLSVAVRFIEPERDCLANTYPRTKSAIAPANRKKSTVAV